MLSVCVSVTLLSDDHCGIGLIRSGVSLSEARGDSWAICILFCATIFVSLSTPFIALCTIHYLYCAEIRWNDVTVYVFSGSKFYICKYLFSLKFHMVFVLLLQLMSAGVGQYPSLYSTPVHSESGKWDALVKASESLLKEKELIIERQVFLIILLLLFYLIIMKFLMLCDTVHLGWKRNVAFKYLCPLTPEAIQCFK